MSLIKSSLVPLILMTILPDSTCNTVTTMPTSRPLLFLRNVRWKSKSPVGCFRRLSSITIDNCITECAARRQRCRAINYRRQSKVCDLCTDIDETALIIDVRTVTVLLSDYMLQMASEERCRDVTCAYLEKCLTNGLTGDTSCIVSECESKDYLEQVDVSRTASAPVNTSISFKTEDCQQRSSSACDIIECRSDGTWSRTFSNIALGKPATQISTIYDGPPGRAVDGNKNAVYASNSCSHTDVTLQPWWMVDLESSQCVNLVRIFNRGDCCWNRLRNLYVYVSEDSNSFTTGDLCGHYIGPGSQGDVITFECCPGRRGRYVRLQADYRNGWNLGGEENVLTLCEVEVY